METYDKNTLSCLLASAAEADKTAPPCWRTNEVLGAIERLVMVMGRNYLAFAEIAEATLSQVSVAADPAVLSLLRLARINGLRRIDQPDVDLVLRLFAEEKELIARLPAGPRQDRCASFWKYQKGVFTAAQGLYAEAGRDMREDAEDTTMPPDKRAIARWSALVYENLAAIVAGDEVKIVKSVLALRKGLPDLRRDMAGSDMETQWVHGNAPCHLLLATMLNSPIEFKILNEDCSADLAEHAETLGQAFAAYLSVFKAEEMRQRGQLNEASGTTLAVVNDSAAGAPVKAIARLILARICRTLGQLDKAREMYAAIRPEADCHAIAAVAARELASLH